MVITSIAKCKLCNEEFEIQYSLKKHVKDIHGLPKEVKKVKVESIEDGHVKCLDCNKIFSDMSGARKHYRNLHLTDINVRNFICNVCYKGFAVKDCLSKHMRVVHSSIDHGSEKHSVEKPKWNQLKRNENGRIDCLTCLKSFACFANAKQHFGEQHVANQKFTCDLCGKIFNVKRNMKSHSRKCHQSTKKQATKLIKKHDKIHGFVNSKQNAKLAKDEENLKIKKESCIVEKGIDFVSSETFDEDFLKTVKVFEKASELGKNPTPVNQNKIKAEVKVEIKEEPLKDLHLVHDNSKQNAKLTEGEENGKLKEERYFDEVHEELGIDFVTSNTFDRDYLKSTENQEQEKTYQGSILCPNCHKPFASCKKWC